jgi:hypothetical protein
MSNLKLWEKSECFREELAMPRIARVVVKGEPAVYHVISRTDLF